jgi:signal transduction histidine kinase
MNANALVTGLEEFVRPLLRNADIQMTLHPDLPEVMADAGQVEQVLMNLIVNSLDAMDGEGIIHIKTGMGSVSESLLQAQSEGLHCELGIDDAETQRAETWAYVDVADDGPGISKEHLIQIFDTFFTTKSESGGTGLGLSIVRTIVQESKGNLLVASDTGKGTRFRLFLPLVSQKKED